MKSRNFLRQIVISATLVGLVKIVSSQPSIDWTKLVGGPANEHVYSITALSDGNYIAAGTSSSATGFPGNYGGYDAVLIKFDSTGHVMWKKNYGGSGDDDAFSQVIEISGGGLIAIGWTNSNDHDVSGNHGGEDDLWMVRLKPGGKIISPSYCFGGSGYDAGYSIAKYNSNYYLFGTTGSSDGNVNGDNHGQDDAWVLRLDKNFVIKWAKCYGGSSEEFMQAGLITKSGKLVITGYTYSIDGDVMGKHGDNSTIDCYAMLLDKSGSAPIWSNCYGGSSHETAENACLTADGNILIVSDAQSTDGDLSDNSLVSIEDSWVLKVDTMNGNRIWDKTIGYPGEITSAWGIVGAGNNDVVVLSQSLAPPYTDHHGTIHVTRLDPTGVSVDYDIAIGGNGDEISYSGVEDNLGRLYICGGSSSNDGIFSSNKGGEDALLIRLSSFPRIGVPDCAINPEISLYPNPAQSFFNIDFSAEESEWIEMQIVNETGVTVFDQEEFVSPGKFSKQIDVSNFPRGSYLISIKAGKRNFSEKVNVD